MQIVFTCSAQDHENNQTNHLLACSRADWMRLTCYSLYLYISFHTPLALDTFIFPSTYKPAH